MRRIREIKADEFDLVISYFLEADEAFLLGMGVEKDKLPAAASWRKLLDDDYNKPLAQRGHYYLIWELDGEPVGHSNINEIIFAKEAKMHLHLWNPEARRHGNGTFFVRQSITHFFETFDLQNLFCQPYAHNPAPNHTLASLGFELLETTHFAPGWLSFPQDVNIWLMTREKWFDDL